MNYRYSLNLPYTDFSMKANLAIKEELILNHWKNINLYSLIISYNSNRIKFLVNDGPPYANGNIHIGHAFNKILKDFINKFKFLEGFNINFIPGWDCHGLPIELNVEKEIGSIGDYLSRSNFRDKCRNYAKKYIDHQKNSFIRLGVIGDWSDCYKTMDYDFESSIVSTLSDIAGRGYIYKGEKPVYWCFNCRSALAEAEVDYLEKTSHSIFITFKVNKNKFFLKKFKFLDFSDINDIKIIVWTTTPWTVPFNEAVAVNPNVKYILLKFNNNGYIFDYSLLNKVVTELNFTKYNILCYFLGKDIFNLELFHPFYTNIVKVILSDHVKNDSGTGCVHIAPAYGLDDYKLGIKYNLTIKNKIDFDGYFSSDVLFFENLNIKDVDLKVLTLLKKNKSLLLSKFINHRYPYCWRHKSPLVFMSTQQWFIEIDDKSKYFLDVASDKLVKWIPSWGKSRMKDMVISRPDWCISRQRTWGVPIVFLFNKNDGKFHDRMSYIMKYISEKIKSYGSDIWYDLDIYKLFNIEKEYIKVEDVLDVWYDSGSIFYFLDKKYKDFVLPFSLCLEGSDQYRGWFQVSLIMSLLIKFNVQCTSILTHGFVLDRFNRKMSKSLNNIIAPSDIISKYGADILRLWVASSNYIVDINVSDEILMRICDAYRRIRNTSRFLLSNLYDFNPDLNLLKTDYLLSIDKWILYSLFNMQKNVIDAYRSYNFHIVYKYIYTFCVDELGSKYLDIVKDRLYTNKKDSISRRSAQSAIYYIIIVLAKLLSPILSFTSEEIWKYILYNKTKTVFLPDSVFNIKNISIDINFWDNMFLLKEEVNKLLERYRKNNIIKSTLDAKLSIYCEKNIYDFLFFMKDELHYFFVTSSVELFLLNNECKFLEETSIDGFYLVINKSPYKKCERCWHRIVEYDVDLCNRCINNLYYDGEKRVFI